MVSGLCLWRFRGSRTMPGPSEAHTQNIEVFFKTLSNPIILSQELKNPYFSRMGRPVKEKHSKGENQ